MNVEESATEMGYVRTAGLAVFQRRLFSPSYMGPGKWVIFDARTRRSHLAVRHEQDLETKAIPQVLRYLLRCATDTGDLAAGQVKQLAAAGLLVPAEENDPDSPNFMTLFQQSVFDYPFVDYASPAAFEFDAALMAEYASVSPMPSPWTERSGRTIELPGVSWADLPTRARSSFGIKELAAVLRFAFGAIGTFHTPGGDRVRKANPSGGAKHPTEGWLELSGTWQGLESGCYVYDAQYHRLVAMPRPSGRASAGPLVLSVRSRVERAMWRYRDARSTRAVLLDAGHVVENVLMLLGLFGVSASLRPAIPGATGDPSTLREPEIARIALDHVDTEVPAIDQRETAAVPVNLSNSSVVEPLAINPLAYFTFGGGRFHAHSLYPELATSELDEADFAILTHCIPSHRGAPTRPRDRQTAPTDVFEAIPDADETRLATLAAAGLLLPANQSVPLYREVRRWAESGWYLPLLAWQEATGSGGVVGAGDNTSSRGCLVGLADVPAGLRNRVTTRSFRRDQVSVDQFVELLRTAYRAADSETVSCYVAPFAVAGVENGVLHRWDGTSDRLDEVGRSVSADDVVKITVGQGWVGSCAAMVWLVARVDLARPGSYFAPHLLLGRMAQRVCVRATIEGLGVFQTPATRDGLLCATLGLSPDPAMTTYSLAVGWPSRRSVSSKEHRGSTR